MNISQYAGVLDNKGDTITVDRAIYLIKNENQKTIEKIRSETDKKKRDAIKKKLPAVTWSGNFDPTRAVENIKEYTGLICLDIDNLTAAEVEVTRGELTADPFTRVLFISPSGAGLKVIIQCPLFAAGHLLYFKSLEKYYKEKYSITVDPSGKDICRLCFLSYDPELYENEDATVWEVPTDGAPELPPANLVIDKQKKTAAPAQTSAETLDDCFHFTEEKQSCTDGNKNKFLFLFCCNACKKGFNAEATLDFCLNHPDLESQGETVIKANVKRAYEKNISEFGKYAQKNKPVFPSPGIARPLAGASKNGRAGSSTNQEIISIVGNFESDDEDKKEPDQIIFWIKSINERTGKDSYSLHPYLMNLFMADAGYHRYKLKGQTYQLIHYFNNVITSVDGIDIQDYIMKWCEAREEIEVMSMLMRGADKYFNAKRFSFLPYKHVEPRRDTATTANFYFKNGIVEITKDAVKLVPYNDQERRVIWEKDIIMKDYKIEANYFSPVFQKETAPGNIESVFTYESDCEFCKYIALVCHNKNGEHKSNETKIKRFMSLCSAIGYMLHGFKIKEGLAVIAVDHQIAADKSEANGRTGKSIVGESLQFFKKVLKIDGREFDEKNRFRFGRLTAEHKIVIMQDCKSNLDFGSFFVPLTNDFSYSMLYQGEVTISYEDSPKFWFDTNYTFKGHGDSFEARQFVIEFDNYFNKSYKPKEEFGHYLFDDWDTAEWDRFYKFMFDCVQIYLSEGLVPYPDSNYGKRKMLQEMPVDFYDWANAREESTNDFANYKINAWNQKKGMLANWSKEARELNMNAVSASIFSKMIKNYCKNEGFYFESYKASGGTQGPGELYYIGTVPPEVRPTSETQIHSMLQTKLFQ